MSQFLRPIDSIQRAVLDGLGDVLDGDVRLGGKVGGGAALVVATLKTQAEVIQRGTELLFRSRLDSGADLDQQPN